NISVGSAIENCAPVLELAYALGSLLRVQLRHAPVVEHFSAAHGVAEMRLPPIGGIDVGHGSSNAAFGHHRVRFAQKGFTDDANAYALRQRSNRGTQPGAAGADHQYAV